MATMVTFPRQNVRFCSQTRATAVYTQTIIQWTARVSRAVLRSRRASRVRILSVSISFAFDYKQYIRRVSMTSADAAKSDQSILEQLNREYVSAFMNSDVNWYDQHLADDFVCIESDGSVLNKTQF